MGSSNSRLRSSPSSGSTLTRTRTRTRTRTFFSSFVCGSRASLSHSRLQMGDRVGESLLESFQNLAPDCDESVNSKQQSSLTSGFETGFSSFTAETGSGSSSNVDIIVDVAPRSSFSNRAESNSHMEAHVAATSLKCQPPMESLSADEPETSLEDQATGNPHSPGETIEGASADGNTTRSGSPLNGQTLPEFLLSVGEQGSIGMGVLLVDVVSIPSNILSSTIAEINNREARRISRRMYWDALSRISFSRNSDSPTIVLTTSHADDLGSHDRWLLDFSGDLHYDGIGRESRYSGSTSDLRGRRRWQSRYEMSERFHDVHDEHGWESSSCVMGLHPHGTCSCDSSFIQEPTSLSGISQLLMVADALFEVIEEIHRHRMSLSLSMLTLPAPEAVVNSFPLKNHKKLRGTMSGTHDTQQCNICLVDYEEGDIIRVLPCSHEYHMSCVDKWLKEIHGVCPLCRDDVCKGAVEGSSSNLETPSL